MRTGEHTGRIFSPDMGGLAGALAVRPFQSGFTLLGLLFLLAILGAGLAALGSVWQTASQREKEAQLLFIGNQYRQALLGYHTLSPGSVKHYPKKLDDLLEDPRFPNTVRHLRRLWPDPITGGDWVLVRDDEGGIKGLHSGASTTPKKTAGFPLEYMAFEGAGSYSDWVFQVAE